MEFRCCFVFFSCFLTITFGGKWSVLYYYFLMSLSDSISDSEDIIDEECAVFVFDN